ncbi:MAG TPA: sulfotransferase [Tepidisphaeraceae bacterium]|jgi:hypothetical protein|nr:sulfotransferase [Tepidisphaeraceae bacterium]
MADVPDQKTFFLIVGLPRSGTSAIAQLLDHLGVYFGDPAHFLDAKKLTHNPIFYELQWVNDFNNRVLKAWNCTYTDDALPIESDFQHPQMAGLREALRNQLVQEFASHAIVGVKDPRICFTFPLWRAVVTEMGYALKTILTLRSPSAVLKSIQAVTPGRATRWQRFYARHLLAVRYFTRDVPVCQFDYDQLMQQPVAYAQQRAADLGLPIPDPIHATRHLTRDHYHHQPDEAGAGSRWVDQIDSDIRAGRLDPSDYLTFREIALLFTEELRALELHPPAGIPEWFRQHQQLLAVFRRGGRFEVTPQPNGTLRIRGLPPP